MFIFNKVLLHDKLITRLHVHNGSRPLSYVLNTQKRQIKMRERSEKRKRADCDFVLTRIVIQPICMMLYAQFYGMSLIKCICVMVGGSQHFVCGIYTHCIYKIRKEITLNGDNLCLYNKYPRTHARKYFCNVIHLNANQLHNTVQLTYDVIETSKHFQLR